MNEYKAWQTYHALRSCVRQETDHPRPAGIGKQFVSVDGARKV